jgi:hypothetical protein
MENKESLVNEILERSRTAREFRSNLDAAGIINTRIDYGFIEVQFEKDCTTPVFGGTLIETEYCSKSFAFPKACPTSVKLTDNESNS